MRLSTAFAEEPHYYNSESPDYVHMLASSEMGLDGARWGGMGMGRGGSGDVFVVAEEGEELLESDGKSYRASDDHS